MLGKRDRIFWAAGAVFLVSLALAVLVDDGFLLLMVVSYLLRPTLHSLGFFRRLVDERQMQIQYRASNVAFAALVAGIIIVILVLMRRGDHTWEMLVAVLMTGLAVRALAGLLMVGDPRVAGVRIIVSVGLLFALFGVLEGGASGGIAHVLPGLLVVGLGFAGRRRPRLVAGVTGATAALLGGVILWTAFRRPGGMNWGAAEAVLLVFPPLIIAAFCLWRGAGVVDEAVEASTATTGNAGR